MEIFFFLKEERDLHDYTEVKEERLPASNLQFLVVDVKTNKQYRVSLGDILRAATLFGNEREMKGKSNKGGK